MFSNHTFYNNGSTTWGGGISVENPDVKNLDIRNNICSQNVDYQILIEYTVQNLTVDYNLVDGYRGYEGEIRGTNYVEGDPKFVDAAGEDFHIQAGSPCIDAADGVNALARDFEGDQRMHDPAVANTGIGPPWVDIGADERSVIIGRASMIPGLMLLLDD